MTPTPEPMVIKCPSCSGQLRVPGDQGNLDVRCPRCKHQFDWSPEHYNMYDQWQSFVILNGFQKLSNRELRNLALDRGIVGARWYGRTWLLQALNGTESRGWLVRAPLALVDAFFATPLALVKGLRALMLPPLWLLATILKGLGGLMGFLRRLFASGSTEQRDSARANAAAKEPTAPGHIVRDHRRFRATDDVGPSPGASQSLDEVLSSVPLTQRTWLHEHADALRDLPIQDGLPQGGTVKPRWVSSAIKVSEVAFGPVLPDSHPQLPTFFGSHSEPICVVRLDPRCTEVLEACARGAVRLFIRAHAYKTHDVMQFVLRYTTADPQKWFQENLCSITDEDVQLFIKGILAHKSWRLFAGYAVDNSASIRPTSLRVARIRADDRLVNEAQEAAMKAAKHIVAIPAAQRDFPRATQQFMADDLPMPK